MKKQKIQFKYDEVAGALYIKVGVGKVAKTEEISACSFVDYNKEGNIIGVEMLNTQKDLKSKKIILDMESLQKVGL